MPDYSAPHSLSEFAAAATRADPTPKATVTMQLDADMTGWFQAHEQAGGADWQQDMNSVLRSYMEDMQAIEAAAPAPDTKQDFAPS